MHWKLDLWLLKYSGFKNKKKENLGFRSLIKKAFLLVLIFQKLMVLFSILLKKKLVLILASKLPFQKGVFLHIGPFQNTCFHFLKIVTNVWFFTFKKGLLFSELLVLENQRLFVWDLKIFLFIFYNSATRSSISHVS